MPRAPAPRSIGFLIFDGFQLLDAAGPIAAFEMPARGVSPPPYTLKVIAPEAGPVRSSCGVAMLADAIPRTARFDTLIVAGGEGTRTAMLDKRVLALVRSQQQHARR